MPSHKIPMHRFFPSVLALLMLCPAIAAHAESWPDPYTYHDPLKIEAQPPASTPVTVSPPAETPTPPAQTELAEPDLVAFGVGSFDFDQNEINARSYDFRAELRFGYALVSASTSWLDFAIHPLAGIETNTRGLFYGMGGFGFDFLLWKHIVATESEAIGVLAAGKSRFMGSVLEFRSQAELGWRFDDGVRFTGYVGHISNAKITHRNPGAEIGGAYLQVPLHFFLNL